MGESEPLQMTTGEKWETVLRGRVRDTIGFLETIVDSPKAVLSLEGFPLPNNYSPPKHQLSFASTSAVCKVRLSVINRAVKVHSG